MQTIPLRSDLPHFDMQVILDNVNYTLELRWNSRDVAWYMDLKSGTEEPILNNVKLVVDFPLAWRGRHADLPRGYFWANDLSGEQRDPGLTDLGGRVHLYYIEESDLG